jgi:thiamine transport system substrate-binding protein
MVRTMLRMPCRTAAAVVAVAVTAGGLAACGDDDDDGGGAAAALGSCVEAPQEGAAVTAAATSGDGTRLTLLTHDSFAVSEGVLEAFTEETGIEVELLAVGDAGTLVSQAVLTRDAPLGDVLFGVDTTLLCRALDNGLFLPYEASGLDDVPEAIRLDPHHRVTPIDYGDVCVNYWEDALDGPPPATLDDLADPRFADAFVTPSPETSSPGLAFLLATIAEYGEDGWEDYWARLRDNGVLITTGWTDAYYGEFVAGGGPRSLVTSYATSPVAEVLFADPPVDEPPTGVLADTCFRQVEFAGILAGTEHPEAAAALVDHLLSPRFQEDVPLNMFVYPARGDVALPELFTVHGVDPVDPLVLDPVAIEAGRDEWTRRWTELVLR